MMADAEKVEKVCKGLELCTSITPDGCLMLCPYKDEQDETYSGFCEQVLKRDAMSVIRELKAENERLRQEKADAVKRIERCRQNCISSEKVCDSAYNKSGKEWYRAKADAYKQALDIIN